MRPQLRSEDEAQLRQAVTSLYQQVGQNEEASGEQAEARPEPDTIASKAGVKKTRPRGSTALDALSSVSRRLSVVVEPTENENHGTNGSFASRQDDPLRFNGMLYNFEFGSPRSRSSRVFEAGAPDAATSHRRHRPRNPAPKAKKSRYSWGGFDLAHRNDATDRDDLIAILEHDEYNLNGIAASSSSQVRRKPSSRRSQHEDKRRSGIVVDNALADSIVIGTIGAIGGTIHRDFSPRTSDSSRNANAGNRNDHTSLENIQAFVPLGRTTNRYETPEKRPGVIRRLSLSLFGRWKTVPLVRNANVHHHHAANAVRV